MDFTGNSFIEFILSEQDILVARNYSKGEDYVQVIINVGAGGGRIIIEANDDPLTTTAVVAYLDMLCQWQIIERLGLIDEDEEDDEEDDEETNEVV